MTSLKIIAALFLISAITICACEQSRLYDVNLETEKEQTTEKSFIGIFKNVISKVGKVIKDTASSVKNKMIEVKDTIQEKVKSIKDEHHRRVELQHQQKGGKKDADSEREPTEPEEVQKPKEQKKVEIPVAKKDPREIFRERFDDSYPDIIDYYDQL